jgi:hypothetical protein
LLLIASRCRRRCHPARGPCPRAPPHLCLRRRPRPRLCLRRRPRPRLYVCLRPRQGLRSVTTIRTAPKVRTLTVMHELVMYAVSFCAFVVVSRNRSVALRLQSGLWAQLDGWRCTHLRTLCNAGQWCANGVCKPMAASPSPADAPDSGSPPYKRTHCGECCEDDDCPDGALLTLAAQFLSCFASSRCLPSLQWKLWCILASASIWHMQAVRIPRRVASSANRLEAPLQTRRRCMQTRSAGAKHTRASCLTACPTRHRPLAPRPLLAPCPRLPPAPSSDLSPDPDSAAVSTE